MLRVLCQHASDMRDAWHVLCSASGAQSSCAQHRRVLHITRLPVHQLKPALSARRVLRVQAGRRARGTMRWRCAPWPRPAQTARARAPRPRPSRARRWTRARRPSPRSAGATGSARRGRARAWPCRRTTRCSDGGCGLVPAALPSGCASIGAGCMGKRLCRGALALVSARKRMCKPGGDVYGRVCCSGSPRDPIQRVRMPQSEKLLPTHAIIPHVLSCMACKRREFYFSNLLPEDSVSLQL